MQKYFFSFPRHNILHFHDIIISFQLHNISFPQHNYLVSTSRGKICIEYSDVTNYNCNRRGLLTIKGNPAFTQVNKRGYW